MKKFSILVLAAMLGLTFMLTGCGEEKVVNVGDSQLKKDSVLVEGDTELAWRFDPPVTVSICQFYPSICKFDDGESIENNVWTRAYEEKAGVKLKYEWSGIANTDFETYINNSVAVNKLPDILPVYTTLFFNLADSGRLQDLTEVIDKYATDQVKQGFELYGGIAKDTCTFGDEILGLAAPSEPQAGMLWIREDWLEEYKLEWPQNTDEMLNVMETFCANDASGTGQTYAMSLSKNLTGLDGFGNSYGAYRGIWIEDGNGGLVRSDIVDTWKEPLTVLRGLMEKGYIDPEFIDKADEDVNNDFALQKIGVTFGGLSSPDGSINLTVEANKDAKWKHGLVYDKDGKAAKMQVNTRTTSFTAVNKNCQYPESVVLMTNIWHPLMHGKAEECRKYHDFVTDDGIAIDSFFYVPFGFCGETYYNYQCYEKVSKALESEDPKDIAELNGEQKGYYDRSLPWKSGDPAGWRMYAIFGPGGDNITFRKVLEERAILYACDWGRETEAWVNRGPEIAYATIDAFSNMIYNTTQDLDTMWDDWVANFKGLEIDVDSTCTEEINEWWQTTGKEGYQNILNQEIKF